jgi:hypothetical protein
MLWAKKKPPPEYGQQMGEMSWEVSGQLEG